MKFYLLQNLEENEVDKYMTKHKLVTHIALVLDLLVPVDVVDGVGNLVGGLGDGDLGLDDTKDDEDLTIGDRIESEQTLFLCSLVNRGSAVAATARAGNSALHLYSEATEAEMLTILLMLITGSISEVKEPAYGHMNKISKLNTADVKR